MRRLCCIAATLLLLAWAGQAGAQFRFPMPEFESGYQYPPISTPAPSRIPAAVDIAVLCAALAAVALAVLKFRSRRLVFLLSLFSLVYFGFYRQGCVCPVGSVQNVLDAGIGHNPGLPLVVAAFFFVPLLFALYFGRVFCAAVCPLGAAQEICAVYPVQVPRPVEAMLGLLPYAYLGLATLAVATGTGYLICRYDPFVGFFRQGASFGMLAAGAALLLLGIVVARPYCRFLCPYGVLLRWASRYSKWHASITPAECTQCRLCEDSCPYGAIRVPTPGEPPAPRRAGARRVGLLLAATPLVAIVGAVTGMASHPALARLHPTVRLAERVAAEEQGLFQETSVESDAFRAGKESVEELYRDADAVTRSYKHGSAWVGGFMGLVVCGRLLRLSVVRKNPDYTADRAACLSCARCFAYCPIEKNDANA